MTPFLMTRHVKERDELVVLSDEQIETVSGGNSNDTLGSSTNCVSSTITPNGDGSCCTQDVSDD